MFLNDPHLLQLLIAIRDKKIVLPDIQRKFVWGEEQIYLFCDSFFRGYPFGGFLFWRVIGSENHDKNPIYRYFMNRFSQEDPLMNGIDLKHREEKIFVLDGQQRLQSSYLSFLGAYAGKELYFDIMTGNHDYDKEHNIEYYVRFFTEPDLKKFYAIPAGHGRKMIRIKDFIELDHQSMDRFAERIIEELNVGENHEAEKRHDTRYKAKYKIQAIWAALRDSKKVQTYTIDSSINDSSDATSISEVAEIFVRVNSGGTRLSKSELIFTLLKSRWKEARTEFQKLSDELNSRGEFQTDTDFIIRALMIFSGYHPRLDIVKMRDEDIMLKFKEIFPRAKQALQSTFDFLTSPSGGAIRTYRLLTSGQRADRGYNVLLPLSLFLYLRPTQEIPESQRRCLRRYLYITIFSRYLVVYVESHLHKLSNIVRLNKNNGKDQFPILDIISTIKEWNHFSDISDFFNAHTSLDPLLNVIHRGSEDFKTLNSRNSPHRDHIFPYSKLKSLNIPDHKINHYANMRLLGQIANILKSDEDPVTALATYSEDLLEEDYLIPKQFLDYEKYDMFLEKRIEMIKQRVNKWLSD